MALFVDPKLYGIETMTLDEQIEKLIDICKSEHARRRLYPHEYHYMRHRGYYERLQKLRTQRDIEAIDKAFERAAQRMEAAE